MGTTGQWIGLVVGAVIGYVIGGPYGAFVGAAIGLGLGSYFDPYVPDNDPYIPDVAEFSVNPAENGLVIPDVLGTTKLTGNIIEAWGNRNTAITEQYEAGKDTETVITGYKYYESWIVALAQGPIDQVYAIYMNDNLIWSGAGVIRPGSGARTYQGVSGQGAFYIYWGDNHVNAHGANGGRYYRGMAHIEFSDYYIGDYNRVPTVKVVFRKSPALSDLNSAYATLIGPDDNVAARLAAAGYPGAFPEYNYKFDYNPAHAAYYVLTEMVGVPSDYINIDSFDDCAETLYNEGIGLGMSFKTETNALTAIQSILNTARAYITWDENGLFKMSLRRGDEDTDALEVIDETYMLEEPLVNRGSWADTVNRVEVQFPDRQVTANYVSEWVPYTMSLGKGVGGYYVFRIVYSVDYFLEIATNEDVGNQEIQGKINSKTINGALLQQGTLVKAYAQRYINDASYPFAKIGFKSNRKLFRYQVGDLLKLSYDPYNITEMVCRVVGIVEEQPDTEEIEVALIEDVDYLSNTIIDTTEAREEYTKFRPYPEPLTKKDVIEAPYFVTQAANYSVIPMAAKESGYEEGYQFFVSIDSGTSYVYNDRIQIMNPYGTLVSGYTNDTYNVDDEIGFQVDFTDEYAAEVIQSITRDKLLTAYNLALIEGTELVTFQTITPVSGTDSRYEVTGVYRGRWDTEATTHSGGSDFFYLGAGKYKTSTNTNYTPGTTRHFKLVPWAGGIYEDLDYASAEILAIEGRAQKPYKPINLSANDDMFRPTYSTGGDIDLTWSPRVRGGGAGAQDPTTTDSTGETYEGSFRLRIYKNGTDLVRTVDPTTNYNSYSYSNATLQSDCSGEPNTIKFVLDNYRVADGNTFYSPTTEITVRKV